MMAITIKTDTTTTGITITEREIPLSSVFAALVPSGWVAVFSFDSVVVIWEVAAFGTR